MRTTNKQIGLIAVAVALTLAMAVIAAASTTIAAYAITAKRDFGVEHGPAGNPGIATAIYNFNNQQCKTTC